MARALQKHLCPYHSPGPLTGADWAVKADMCQDARGGQGRSHQLYRLVRLKVKVRAALDDLVISNSSVRRNSFQNGRQQGAWIVVADRLLRGGWWDRPGGQRGSRQAGDMGPGICLGRSREEVRILGRGDVGSEGCARRDRSRLATGAASGWIGTDLIDLATTTISESQLSRTMGR